MSNSQLNISELDFEAIKSSLKTFLKSQTRFQDYDFDGSNMSVLLDILAYNTYMNNFYSNMVFSEMFLDSAQLEESISSHAKHLNYLPRSRKSAKATATVTFSANDAPARITIPKFQLFTGTAANNQQFTFSTSNSYVVEPTNGIYRVDNVELYEGRILSERFLVTGNVQQAFVLSNKNIDTDSIELKVFDSGANNSNSTVYTYRSGLFGVAANDHVFYLQPNSTDKYQIYFGQNVFGKQPLVNNVVQARYRISSGDLPNGVDSFSFSSIGGYSGSVSNISTASGGANKETLENIKFFAPKSIQVQERAVTANDYKILLQQRFSDISAISVYGGENSNPPQFGKVIIVVRMSGQDFVTDNQKEQFITFLKDKNTITMEPIIVAAENLYLDVSGTIFFDQTVTNLSASQIKADVIAEILSYSSTYLEDFDRDFKHSKFLSHVDSSDQAITSSTITVRPVIEVKPTLNSDIAISLNFGNPLKETHPIYTGENLHTRKTAIRSSLFTVSGQQAFLIDDGKGKLRTYSSLTDGSFAVINDNVGTVDYETGLVEISSLNVSSFEGTAIKFYATTSSVNIEAVNNKIISIRPEDISITVSKE